MAGQPSRPILIVGAVLLAALLLGVEPVWAEAALAGEAVAAADSGSLASLAEVEISPGLVWLDTVLVTASGLTDPEFPWSAAVTTVIPLQGETGGSDLAELLARVAGLQVRRYGGLGAAAVPAIRGSAADQIVLMVDGVPLVDAQYGGIDLSTLPLERYAAAEIFRGLTPAQHGGIGGVGAINLISQPLAETGNELRLFGGSFGDVGGRWLSQRGCRGCRQAGMLLLHGRRIDNRFEFLDHNQTFHNSEDDFRRRRGNGQFSEYGLYAAQQYQAARVHLTAAGGYFRRDGGRPGPLSFESPHAVVRHQRTDGRLAVTAADGLLRADLTASHTEQRLHDDAAEVGFDPPGTIRSDSRQLGGRMVLAPVIHSAEIGWPLPAGLLQLRAGGDWHRQWYRESWPQQRQPMQVRTTVSGFAALDLQLYGPRLTLLPAWRWQRLADEFPPFVQPWLPGGEADSSLVRRIEHASSPSAGLIWEASRGRLFLETHGSRTLRIPTWIELFGWRGGIDGNQSLRPERVTSCDLAARWRHPEQRWRGRLALFAVWVEDAILFRQNSQRTSRAENFGATRTRGLELELIQQGVDGLSWSLNLTWQQAQDTSSDPAYRGKELPFLPPLEATLHLEKAWGQWRGGMTLNHASGNYRDRYNTDLERAPARTVVSLSLLRRWTLATAAPARHLTMVAEAVNVTGNDVYDVEGFPLPGRSFRFSLRLQ
jgi:iron complex outermembrane receptor protein